MNPTNSDNPQNPPTPPATVSTEQLDQLKARIINNAKNYAMSGTKIRRTPDENDIGNKAAYDYWDRQDSFENSQWSTYYWKFDDGKWEIQLTKIELKPDGHSQMGTYSIRPDDDLSFPGIQVYLEEKDKAYRKASPEDVVYLDRVTEGLMSLNSG